MGNELEIRQQIILIVGSIAHFFRTAYREGVVITVCKGCDSKHLIADNIGFTGLDLDGTVEEYLTGKGIAVDRVSTEVFELEKMLDFDTTGGAIVGDDGRPVLE